MCLCPESFATPGSALWSDGQSDDGLGDPAAAGSDALWRTALLSVNDGIYGEDGNRCLVETGIEEVKTAYRSLWQNPFVERYDGTLRRELLNHVIILNEEHLKGLLNEFIEQYYHLARPHQGLDGKTPFPSAKHEPMARASRLISIPVVGGLQHGYVRVAA
jgi:putative transposase